MQGMIILNEYMETLMKPNPIYYIVFASWVVSYMSYWLLRNKIDFSELILLVAVLCTAAILHIPDEVGYKERRVIETYLDSRASIPRLQETYEIIEQRGKIYVLTEKE